MTSLEKKRNRRPQRKALSRTRNATAGKPRNQRRQFGNFDEADSMPVVRGLPGVFSSTRLRSIAQADATIVRLRYETTSAFTSTSGAASFVQIKGNSIYRPYAGNTDSVGGYSRMYADYKYAQVLSSRLIVRLWGGVAGQDEPFRIIVIPCSSDQYTVYSAFTNICQLWDVPHAKQALFSPGGVLPTLSTFGTTQSVLLGNSTEAGQEFTAGSLTTYGAVSGSDPTSLWYFLIGYQNMAGTTTTNQQAQVSVEYTVRFVLPIATPVQVAMRMGREVTKYGTEIVPPRSDSQESKTALLEVKREAKVEETDVDIEDLVLIDTARSPLKERVLETWPLEELELEVIRRRRAKVAASKKDSHVAGMGGGLGLGAGSQSQRSTVAADATTAAVEALKVAGKPP